MAYPTISAPYGFKTIGLLGGRDFTGAVRQLPISNGYATSIFCGDAVVLTRGFINRASLTTGTGANQATGIFLGCSYQDPNTKQSIWSQYYPASTASGSIMAYVCDDPDVVFKAAMVTSQGGTTIGSASQAVVGLNLVGSDLAGSTFNGDSSNGILSPTTTPSATTPFRIIELVKETAFVAATGVGSSSGANITILSSTGSPLTGAVVAGTDVSYLSSTGQVVQTGSYLTTAYSAGATGTLVMNQAALANIPSNSTIIFTQYPEVLCKFDFGIHSYYSA